MASEMTRDNAGGASAGPDRTTIFKDVRFWLARRLLDRYDLANKIKSHGGVVVPLEKDADMLIADKARKDAPEGSYSYMFILDSVDNGFIQIKDKYRIGPDPDMPKREKGPSRSFRTAFTAEDDIVLAKWVLGHPHALKGNETWKELYELNQRHTFHSWRDRYLKRYQDLSPAQLEALVAEASETADKPYSHTPAESKERSGPSRAVERDGGQQDETRVPSSADKNRSVQRPKSQKVSPPTKSLEPRTALDERDGSEEVDTVDPLGDQLSVVEEDAASHEESSTEKERFYHDFQIFLDLMEMDIEMQCEIGGRSFELWDLHEATDSQTLPFQELDWVKVAADLGYDQTRRKKVAGSLQRFYENILMEFCHGLASFDHEDENQEKVSEVEPDGGSGEPDPASDARQPTLVHELPPSPLPPSTATTATKRASSASWRSPKRMRLDQNVEIPSTPGMDRSPFRSHPVRETPSPSLRKSIAQRASFPGRNGKANLEKASVSLRRDMAEQNMVSSTIGDPFMSSPVTQGRVPSRRQESEDIAVCGSWVDQEDASLMTSPSTVKALPNAPRRTLPSSFQPPTSSFHPTPRSQSYTQLKKDRSNKPRDNEERGISWWKKHYESLGYSRELIREAMFKTSMVPGTKVEVVLQSLKDGQGVPPNHEGIWTEKDDKYLKFVDSVLTKRKDDSYTEAEMPNKKRAENMLRRLEHKHSPDLVEHRRRFLEVAATTIPGGLQ